MLRRDNSLPGGRRDRVLSSAEIALSLLRSGYAHSCERCARGMHVRYASGLCVFCFNAQRDAEREPQLTRSVRKRKPRSAPAPA